MGGEEGERTRVRCKTREVVRGSELRSLHVAPDLGVSCKLLSHHQHEPEVEPRAVAALLLLA